MANVLKEQSGKQKYWTYLEKSCRGKDITPREVNALLLSQEVAREYGVDPFKIRFHNDGSINKDFQMILEIKSKLNNQRYKFMSKVM